MECVICRVDVSLYEPQEATKEGPMCFSCFAAGVAAYPDLFLEGDLANVSASTKIKPFSTQLPTDGAG